MSDQNIDGLIERLVKHATIESNELEVDLYAAATALASLRDEENAAWVKANDRAVAAEAENARLREALRIARQELIAFTQSRGSEYEGTEDDLVGFIDVAIAQGEK